MIYKRLLNYLKHYKAAFALAILGNILLAIADASFVYLVSPICDRGLVSQDAQFMSWVPLIIVGIFLVRAIASVLALYFMAWVGRQIVMKLRQEVFNHLLVLPVAYLELQESGKFLSKMIYNIEQVAEVVTNSVTVAVKDSFKMLSLFAVMIKVSWQYTLCFFIIMPFVASLMLFFNKKLRLISVKVQDSIAVVTHKVQEVVNAQKMIRIFSGSTKESHAFTLMTQINRKQESKLIFTSALSISIIQLLMACTMGFCIYLATANKIALSPGGFAALFSAMIAMLNPIKNLTRINSAIQKGLSGAQSIFDLLDQSPENDQGATPLLHIKGEIEYRGVNFTYNQVETETATETETQIQANNMTLSNINFRLRPGEVMAIVGRSGSGKSTLVNLLARFYEYDSGVILIDNHPITSIPLKQLRHHISMVAQPIILFNQSIADNIAYGCAETVKNEAAIIAAAKSAHAYEFIQDLPDGFATMVGDNGLRLSEGQKQRIAIARAILKQAPILILDEATSSLDSESENKIKASLTHLMEKSTTLVIAHRLSTIENADRIMVIDAGAIVEIGTHHELMKKNGVYASLRRLQSEPERMREEVLDLV